MEKQQLSSLVAPPINPTAGPTSTTSSDSASASPASSVSLANSRPWDVEWDRNLSLLNTIAHRIDQHNAAGPPSLNILRCVVGVTQLPCLK
jgi:hypothetical protein